ncbi:unnamed protein product [Mycena citricolor]|uniref:poly(A)-specific ribonuclease n=1 Tax=Mycena citricolor TaxID=2018698 RepID=A0AAD2HXK1_9AGAR|nr:unnamed protein product [Mycena citricolor]
MYAPDSIDLLQKSGIDFQRHDEIGISPNDFAELMISSGLVLSDETKWISFHSGYDFGYFVKLLTNASLPTTEEDFFDLLSTWFPTVYDIKYMMRASNALKGGLQQVADDLGVTRIGPSHQAGSDSLLTASTFFKMVEIYFQNQVNDAEYSGKLYGLGQTVTNGMIAESGRGGMTIAEREDRAIARETHNQTPGPGSSQNGVGMGLTNGGLSSQMANSSYSVMGAAPYLRQAMVGGR